MSGLCLPETTRELIASFSQSQRHPGLQLDKFSVPGDQKAQLDAITKVCAASGNGKMLEDRRHARDGMLAALNAQSFSCVTTGPLTLHLARASALENAGICLHHIYGFTYLPGSGLKGMARAYAETVWLPTQEDKLSSWEAIEDVFGWAPNPDRRKQICDESHPAHPRLANPADPKSREMREHTGRVVFHDAWPESWPRLVVDIVNCHHPKYYNGEDAPGDWENPIPVYFLAVPAGTRFSFALSARAGDQDTHLVDLARGWLLSALCHLGAGAKTNAGYGAFAPIEGERPALDTNAPLAVFEAEVELVTPAFLAGVSQKAEDCDLRPATLRGLLRWWWRTMHAGFVDFATLRRMEGAIWGDTSAAGAVRVAVEEKVKPLAKLVPGKVLGKTKKGNDALNLDKSFASQNHITSAQQTTQPLFYASYGTDELVAEEVDRRIKKRKQRYCAFPGARWMVRLSAKSGEFFDSKDAERKKPGKPISKDAVLSQAQAALWLLCEYGGAGSKSRNGFGSLNSFRQSELSLERCLKLAQEFRSACGCDNSYDESKVHSPALAAMLPVVEVCTSWNNYWFAMNEVGRAMQSFAQAPKDTNHGKHCESKIALGLPRQIHGPLGNPLPHQRTHTPPKKLNGPKGERHASPVHFHVTKSADGSLTIRVAAFRSRYLPDWEASQKFLEKYMSHLKTALEENASVSRGSHHQSSFPVHTGRLAEQGPPRDIPPIAPPSSETWADAVLTWNPGNHTLAATHEKGRATTNKPELIPEPIMGKLKKKKKTVKASVVVKREGNRLEVIEIKTAGT